MEHSIQGLVDEAQGGNPPDQLPKKDINGLAGFTASWFCVLADLYRHNGDKEFVRHLHDSIVSLLKYRQTQYDQQNRFNDANKEWDFCDWAPDFVTDSPKARATTQLYDIYGAHEAIYLLREIGDSANADKFSAWTDALTAAVRQQESDPGTHLFSDKLQENAMAVLSPSGQAGRFP